MSKVCRQNDSSSGDSNVPATISLVLNRLVSGDNDDTVKLTENITTRFACTTRNNRKGRTAEVKTNFNYFSVSSLSVGQTRTRRTRPAN